MKNKSIEEETKELQARVKKRINKNKKLMIFLNATYPYVLGVMATVGIFDLTQGNLIGAGIIISAFFVVALLEWNHSRFLHNWQKTTQSWSDRWFDLYQKESELNLKFAKNLTKRKK